jgi:hypothetical protein
MSATFATMFLSPAVMQVEYVCVCMCVGAHMHVHVWVYFFFYNIFKLELVECAD